MDRRTFIKSASAIALALPATKNATAATLKAKGDDFVFARLRYASGNWDADPKMPSNLLNSLVEYTSIRIEPNERIVDIHSEELSNYPFVYLTGNKMVRFTEAERLNLR